MSAWFEEQGLLDKSLQHALAAGDLDLAARLMSADSSSKPVAEDLAS